MAGELVEIIKVTCDGPRCASRNGDKPVNFMINKQAADKDPISNIPEEFVRGFDLAPFGGPTKWFCGPRCLKDFLDYAYVVPKTPRQLAAEAKLPPGLEKQAPPPPPYDKAAFSTAPSEPGYTDTIVEVK